MITEALFAAPQMKSMPTLQAYRVPRSALASIRSRHRSLILPLIRSTANRESAPTALGERPREVQTGVAVSKRTPKDSHARSGPLSSVRNKAAPTFDPEKLMKEQHKYFDHVVITVRSGDGGHGAVLRMPKPNAKDANEKKRKGTQYKRDSDGSLILPMGGHGGDVVIFADESVDSLLQFHKKSRYNAKRGGNVNAMGVLTSQVHDGTAAPTLRIPVPIGTVVKSKRGRFLADLVHPGDEIHVARGGQGGITLLDMEHRRKRSATLTTNVMRTETDKVLVLGQPGEEVGLELILRVVADVGLVGLPNAGKSTLLAALTRAKPNIADYPFTTLMPNLGRIGSDPGSEVSTYSSDATLADLPGLIEGAHLGKGLGRNFLRHLRRTHLLVHVVDAAADNPVNDYRIVKEELRMYNPSYLERPYIVVLNKIDLPMARDRLSALAEEISKIGCLHEPTIHVSEAPISKLENCYIDPSTVVPVEILHEREEKTLDEYPRPLAVVGASVLKRIGVDEMVSEIRAALNKSVDKR